MPITLQSNLKTPQPYIPFVGNGDQGKVLGVNYVFDDVTALGLAVDDQRTTITNALTVYSWLHNTPHPPEQ